MLRRPHYIAFGIILFLLVVIFSLPSQTATQIKLAVGGLFLPLFGLASSTQALSEKVTAASTPKRALLKQLQELSLENQRLRLQAMQDAQLWQENTELRQALGWQRQQPWKSRLKLARVVLRDPANWWRTVQIDLGQRDGVVTNLPVLTVEGLVGKVTQVSLGHSQVVLVGDPGCRVSVAVVTGQRPELGIITPSGSPSILEPRLVDLTCFERQSSVQPGQKVITSGQGGIFPPNIPVGEIVQTNSFGYGMMMQARVKLAADLSRLDKVWVLFP